MTAVLATSITTVLGFPFVMQAQEASVPPGALQSPLPSASLAGASTVSPVPTGLVDEGLVPAVVPARVTVEAGDLWFSPNEITIDSSQPTVLALTGVGQLAHNLTLADLDLQLSVGPGTTSEVTVVDLPPGTYPFYCSVFGHARGGMYGTLTVVGPAMDPSGTPVPTVTGSERSSEPVPSPES